MSLRHWFLYKAARELLPEGEGDGSKSLKRNRSMWMIKNWSLKDSAILSSGQCARSPGVWHRHSSPRFWGTWLCQGQGSWTLGPCGQRQEGVWSWEDSSSSARCGGLFGWFHWGTILSSVCVRGGLGHTLPPQLWGALLSFPICPRVLVIEYEYKDQAYH